MWTLSHFQGSSRGVLNDTVQPGRRQPSDQVCTVSEVLVGDVAVDLDEKTGPRRWQNAGAVGSRVHSGWYFRFSLSWREFIGSSSQRCTKSIKYMLVQTS
jgi:hypothetical protein